MKNKIVAIVGPTASGKTKLGVEMAKRNNGEVISCDSMQIYMGMDIATAKPTEDEQQGIAHHLLGFVPVVEQYSVARYLVDAQYAVEEIIKRKHNPIFVGGTGLYITSFFDGITFSKEEKDDSIRNQLMDVVQNEGVLPVYHMLEEIDPQYAKTLHPNNVKRVIRAIEFYKFTGKTMTEQLKLSRQKPSPYEPITIGLDFKDRKKLYDRINLRVEQMLERGLLEEALGFFKNNNGKTAAQAIGIKELLPYLLGEDNLENCVSNIKMETRRYAKRQITWFKRDPNVHWFYVDDMEEEELTRKCDELIKGEM